MKPNHVLGMVCGYYLSRCDVQGREALGYASWGEAYQALGRALGVAPRSIQNWRDEFDPIHDNPRSGWHGRRMAPSRIRMAERLEGLSCEELRVLVGEAISEPMGPGARRFLVAAADVDSD